MRLHIFALSYASLSCISSKPLGSLEELVNAIDKLRHFSRNQSAQRLQWKLLAYRQYTDLYVFYRLSTNWLKYQPMSYQAIHNSRLCNKKTVHNCFTLFHSFKIICLPFSSAYDTLIQSTFFYIWPWKFCSEATFQLSNANSTNRGKWSDGYIPLGGTAVSICSSGGISKLSNGSILDLFVLFSACVWDDLLSSLEGIRGSRYIT